MQIEHHLTAGPPEETPQMRYQMLRRQIDRGMASDRTWVELSEACVDLNRPGEALECLHHIEDFRDRDALETRLAGRGIQRRGSSARHSASRPAVRGTRAPSGVMERQQVTTRGADDPLDVLRYLSNGPMARTLVLATAIFPITVSLAGYLKGTTSSPVVEQLAVVPAVLLTMLVVAMARAAVVDSAKGLDDAPDVPGLVAFVRGVVSSVTDVTVLAVLFVGPAVVAHHYGVEFDIALGSAIGGLFVLPMAFGLRTVCGDWRALSPWTMLKAMLGGRFAYLRAVITIAILLAPAAAVWHFCAAPGIHLRLALTGPLLLGPLLASARILGRFFHSCRHRLPLAVVEESAPAAAHDRQEAQPRRQRRSAPGQSGEHRAQQGGGKRRSKSRLRRQFADNGGCAGEAPATGSRPVAERRPTRGADRQVAGDQAPDIASMPGFSVVRAEDREAAGAAASSRTGASYG